MTGPNERDEGSDESEEQAGSCQAARTARSVTLQQVADAAGVSIATASRALNGGVRSVSVATGRRVRRLAEEMGYEVHVGAQAMARGWAMNIGFVAGDLADIGTARLLSVLHQIASSRDFGVLVAQVDDEATQLISQLALLGRRGAQLVVLSGLAGDLVTTERPERSRGQLPARSPQQAPELRRGSLPRLLHCDIDSSAGEPQRLNTGECETRLANALDALLEDPWP